MSDVVYVCGIPSSAMRVVSVVEEPERWCFGERQRRAGKTTWSAPTLEYLEATEAWGWAEPTPRYECDGCGQDRRAGFGYVMTYGGDWG